MPVGRTLQKFDVDSKYCALCISPVMAAHDRSTVDN